MKPAIEDRTVVVTGGSGFIGSHLVEAVAPTNDVRVVDTAGGQQSRRFPTDVDVVTGDVRDAATRDAALDGADVLFHEAAIASVERSIEEPEESHAVNVDATLSLLETARRTGTRVVFASSAAIYGDPDRVPVSEDEPKAPNSPYGLEKLSGDHYCRLYNHLYDVETVSLRYFNVYGPRQSAGSYSGVISTFVSQAQSGGPITVQGDGEQTRDFVHVRDVVRANLLAATTDSVGEAFNVGSGEQVSIATLAEHVRNAIDPEIEIVHTGPRSGDVRASCADISKAEAELGYEPTRDIETGIGSLVQWKRRLPVNRG
ncbi:NAD-dependent epimerase/dehydratase family protein [Halococcus hamelinensis]|nr:NAD-dependent epimerase/dehydratase family protein [Halococcus hamelinensis]